MNTGRYGYGRHFEIYIDNAHLSLYDEARKSPQGFKAVVNRLMRKERWNKAQEIFDTFRNKWGDEI